MLKLATPSECHLCTDLMSPEIKNAYLQFRSNKRAKLKGVMQHSLYAKYSSSQNYHYTRELNEILTNQRTHATIAHRDQACFDEVNEDCLNRLYSEFESDEKLAMLGEYYKFHNDIPRMFMLPAIVSLNWFHDRKRRLEYFRIARLIELENNNNPDKPPKGIVGDSPAPVRESENLTDPANDDTSDIVVRKDKILDELSWLKNEQSVTKHEPKNQKISLKLQLQKLKFQEEQPQPPMVKQTTIAQSTTIQQQIRNLQAAFQNNHQKQTQKIGKWKKNLRLDEVALKSHESADLLQNHTARNMCILSCQVSANRNQPSDRQVLTQKASINRQLRPSLVNILQIIKNTPGHQHTRSKPRNEQSKSDMPPPSQDSQTPRQVQASLFMPARVKEKRNPTSNSVERISALIQSSKMLTQVSKSPYTQASIEMRTKHSPLSQQFPKSPFAAQMCGNITPRNAPLTSPKTSPKPGQQIHFKQKVQMLELKVLTDLQHLQNKKGYKKHCTLQLDSVSRIPDPKSLTQRVLTSDYTDFNTLRLKSIYNRRKEQTRIIEKPYPSGTQSHRGQVPNVEQYLMNKNKNKAPAINTSNDKGNQMYYNNMPDKSQPSQVSTFATQNQSSCQNSININKGHTKSQSFNKVVKVGKQDLDSQLFKAAITIAKRPGQLNSPLNLFKHSLKK